MFLPRCSRPPQCAEQHKLQPSTQHHPMGLLPWRPLPRSSRVVVGVRLAQLQVGQHEVQALHNLLQRLHQPQLKSGGQVVVLAEEEAMPQQRWLVATGLPSVSHLGP